MWLRAAAALALFLLLARGGTASTILNFTLVATTNPDTPSPTDEEALGFYLAMMDAQNHMYGLLPNHHAQIVDRTVTHNDPSNPAMVKQAVLGLQDDNAVAFLGGVLDGAFLLHSILEFDNMPQANLSPLKHLPTASAIRDFGANPDMRTQCQGFARLLQDSGINTVTLITVPEQTFMVYSLFYELELPNAGVRVHEKIVMEAGRAGDVVDQVLESDIHAVVVISWATDLESLLLAGEERNMTQGGYAWFVFRSTAVEPYVTSPNSLLFPNLTRLVAEAKVIGLAFPEVDASLPAVQALRERASQLPPIPSVQHYNVTRDGVSTLVALAYDTGMAMLRAVNRTIAAGESPHNHTAVIAAMGLTHFDTLTGHLHLVGNGYGGLLHDVLFRQFSTPASAATGATVRVVMTYNTRYNAVQYTGVQWNTDDGLPPPNFTPESCGVLFSRFVDGTCVPCGPGMRNDPTDGLEECAFCDDGTELQGEECVACGLDEESSRLDSGEPICKAESHSDLHLGAMVAIVGGSVAGTALLVAIATLAYRKVERTRAEIAEHRAKARQAQFLGFSFHEMRNPLNVVSGALEFATSTIKQLAKDDEEGGNDNKALGPVLKDLRCGRQCLVDTVHVLDTINMLSQIIHGVVEVEMQPTCPKELAKEVIAAARQVRSGLLSNEDAGEEVQGEGQQGDAQRGPSVVLDAMVQLDGVEIGSRDFFVAMDRQKMRQALMILLINALKYTSKGRIAVEISLKRQSPNRNSIDRGSQGNAEPVAVRMCVSDTGSGIPPEDLEHMFDLDYQTKHGSVRSTGLGLVLAHRIVGMHGGELRVRSVHSGNAKAKANGKAPGQATGTRFTWTIATSLIRSVDGLGSLAHGEERISTEMDDLRHADVQLKEQQPSPQAKPGIAPPVVVFGKQKSSLKEPPERAAKPASSTTSSAGNVTDMLLTMPTKLRVLLMEDVKLNRTFMRRKLATFPFSELDWVVEEVETGEKCLELIIGQGQQFDVVFCDQILSNAGGKLLGNEVARTLREHEKATHAEKRMVLIACSGNASDEDRKLYAESGMDGVVAKPLPAQKVLFKFLHPLLAHGDFAL